MKAKILFALLTPSALIVALLATLNAGFPTGKPPADRKAPPSKDFVEGFESGVRYGLIARMEMLRTNDAKKDDIPTITGRAKEIYWLIVVDEGKSLAK